MILKATNTFNKTVAVYYDDRYRQIVSMGGSRSSKSYSILQMLMLEMIRTPMLKITVWRDTKVTCRATVLEDFSNIIMFNPYIYSKFKHNKLSGTFTYKPNGSRIIFEGADNIGKVLGGAQHISFFNEVTEFSKEVYLQITQRTSGKVICDYNPSKDFWLEKYRFDEKTAFIHSDFRDNAYCPKNIVEQLLSYEPWETGSYEIVDSEVYYLGKPISKTNQPPPHKKNVEKGTANEFMWLVYGLGIGAEKPNRIYKGWKKVTIEEFNELPYESYFGCDFGAKNPTAIVEVKYNGDGTFYICLRFYKALSDIKNSLATTIRNEIPHLTGNSLIVCDSARMDYVRSLQNSGYTAIGAKKGNNSVTPGITKVQNANIHYVHEEDIYNEYSTYSWKVDRYEKSTDEPDKKDDHAMDAIRYIITYLIDYLGIEL